LVGCMIFLTKSTISSLEQCHHMEVAKLKISQKITTEQPNIKQLLTDTNNTNNTNQPQQ